jgi:hypothetical protein
LPESGGGPLFAPIGTIGWASQGSWYLPQVRSTFACSAETDEPGHYEHIFAEVLVHQPWHYTDPRCTTSATAVSPTRLALRLHPDSDDLRQDGDIQVTLTWYNADPGVDLDLWVMDPDSEWCYYGNDETVSGGVLDRDNWCANYENGRPENIFWTSTPPAGEYIVAVDWYSTCGTVAVGSLPFNVRTVVQGTTRTYAQTINENESMHEVARFTIGGGAVVFQPPHSNVSWAHLPAKCRRLSGPAAAASWPPLFLSPG